jgi:hypothetical protein
MAEKTVLERALTAIDDALVDELKRHFTQLVANQYSEKLEAALGQFGKGVGDLKTSHARARAIVQKCFGDPA